MMAKNSGGECTMACLPWFKDNDRHLLRSLLPIKDHSDINEIPFVLLQTEREFLKPFQYWVI
jgi:hypothetical protein